MNTLCNPHHILVKHQFPKFQCSIMCQISVKEWQTKYITAKGPHALVKSPVKIKYLQPPICNLLSPVDLKRKKKQNKKYHQLFNTKEGRKNKALLFLPMGSLESMGASTISPYPSRVLLVSTELNAVFDFIN